MFITPKKAVIRRKKTIKADIVGKGLLELRGNLHGNVEVDELFISRTGVVTGNVIAETVHVFGVVKGSIQARHVIIERGARVEGELSYEQLSVAPQADLAAKLMPRPLLKILNQRQPVIEVLQGIKAVA